MTLDDWLSASDCDNVYSGELLEVVPAEFAEEYRDRCRRYSEYENKSATLRTAQDILPVRPSNELTTRLIDWSKVNPKPTNRRVDE